MESPLVLVRPRDQKPSWLKVKAPGSPGYIRLKRLMGDLKLNTVCEEAHCPNIGECWHHGTATFMILGDVCTQELPLLRGRPRPPGRPRHRGTGPGCERRRTDAASLRRHHLGGP